MSTVTECEQVTLSCGSGTLSVPTPSCQVANVDQLPVAAEIWFAGVVNVIPVFRLQLPEPPVIADKSTALVEVISVILTLAVPVQFVAVIVAGLPKIEDCTFNLFVIELPIMAKVVQVKVVPDVNVTVSVLVAVPVRVNEAIPVGLPETV
jgi:hypothetical protein